MDYKLATSTKGTKYTNFPATLPECLRTQLSAHAVARPAAAHAPPTPCVAHAVLLSIISYYYYYYYCCNQAVALCTDLVRERGRGGLSLARPCIAPTERYFIFGYIPLSLEDFLAPLN